MDVIISEPPKPQIPNILHHQSNLPKPSSLFSVSVSNKDIVIPIKRQLRQHGIYISCILQCDQREILR